MANHCHLIYEYLFPVQTYDVLLEVDELEKQALALPEEARPQVLVERQRKIECLLERLKCEESQDNSFLKLITLRKGIKLLSRSLPLFSRVSIKM